MDSYILTEKEQEVIEKRIEEIKDRFTDLRKEGKDPFMQVVELKEVLSRWGVVQVDPTKELVDGVKKLLKKIKLELSHLAKEQEEDLFKEYNKKEGDE